MQIKLNGKKVETQAKTIAELIATLPEKPSAFALVLNGQIIPKSDFNETLVNDGDNIEIFMLMAGG